MFLKYDYDWCNDRRHIMASGVARQLGRGVLWDRRCVHLIGWNDLWVVYKVIMPAVIYEGWRRRERGGNEGCDQ